MKKQRRITEAQRRQQLVAELSETKIIELTNQMRKARAALEARVSGGTELEVLWLMRDLDNLLQMLVEFDDTRTEISIDFCNRFQDHQKPQLAGLFLGIESVITNEQLAKFWARTFPTRIHDLRHLNLKTVENLPNFRLIVD